MENMVKRAYFYFLSTDDRLSEFVVSASSLKDTGTTADICCIVDDTVSPLSVQIIKTLGVKIFLNESGNALSYKTQPNEYGNQFVFGCIGKFLVHEHTEYDKIVYLDADTFILKNIDELFSYPDMSMSSHHDNEEQVSNGGVLVIEPRHGLYDEAIAFTELSARQNQWSRDVLTIDPEKNKQFACHDDLRVIYDQEYLFYKNKLFNHPCRRLPYIYNCLISTKTHDPLFDAGAVKVAHFVWKYKVWATCIALVNKSHPMYPIMEKYKEYFHKVISGLREKFPDGRLFDAFVVAAECDDF